MPRLFAAGCSTRSAGTTARTGFGAGSLAPTSTSGSGAATPAEAPDQPPGSCATGTPSCAATMNSCQASAGNAPPVTFFIGVPSSLPNQTPVVRFAV